MLLFALGSTIRSLSVIRKVGLMSEETSNASELPELQLVLSANGIEVARSKDRQIWLNAMAAITGAEAGSTAGPAASPMVDPPDSVSQASVVVSAGDPLSQFAEELGVAKESLEAAAYPSEDEPYIHLDAKYWEAFRRTSGYGRIAPSVLVATLLLLWDRRIAKMGDLGTRDCAKVFTAIGLNDKNPTRSIRNCDWLQLRGNTIKLNPANISRAEEVAATYCSARG